MATGQEKVKSLSEVFSSLIENLQFAIDQIKEGENKRTFPANFSLDEFWSNIDLLVMAMSQESTKLCLAFSYPPTPTAEDSHPLFERIEKVTIALVSAYYSFPPSQGKTLQMMIRKSVISIIQGVQTMVSAIKSSEYKGSPDQLKSTGNVWECCDNFPSLPKENKSAVIKVTKDAENMVKDALQEIDEEYKECNENLDDQEDSDEPRWSNYDLHTVSSAIGLVKTARALAKKVHVAIQQHGECNSEESNNHLDDLAAKLERLSPASDDFVLTLYPPMDRDSILAQCEELSALMSDILSTSRNSHITSEGDQAWIEFLEKAIEHNKGKLQTS